MHSLPLKIRPQPDDVTCGPTCLHALYRFHGDEVSLRDLLAEVPQLPEGGTLGVLLALHALSRGYAATLYTYNLSVFDPTWFNQDSALLPEKLRRQAEIKSADFKLQAATKGYLEFIERGGRVLLEDLTLELLARPLARGLPVLTGLSSTFLYRCPREIADTGAEDDLAGTAAGHFVVLTGVDARNNRVMVADPSREIPGGEGHLYEVSGARLLAAVLLGVLTYDANFLILEPPAKS